LPFDRNLPENGTMVNPIIYICHKERILNRLCTIINHLAIQNTLEFSH